MKEVVMNCNEIRELMPDLAAGLSAATPEAEKHLRSCAECAGKLEAMRKTMALLDEWQAPEPSPYFDVRLQARLREEMAKQPAGWWQWIRRPALAVSLALIMVASVTLFRSDSRAPKAGQSPLAQVEPGTAVGDLQALDKNTDMYADFDILDDLQVQQNVTANP
jgi:predicted anti-sigma-YlaC factor YlaD